MSAIYEHAAAMWRDMHAEWQDVMESEFAQAEEWCIGYMVTSARRGEVSNRELWSRPRAYQRRHGTAELNDWLDRNLRTTLERYELQWMRGRVWG